MLEPVESGHPLPRAFLRVGGLSLARHQLGIVMALGCERVICIARGLDPELVVMQHAAERVGMQFHVVNGARALAGLVTATDEVIVLGEGLLAMPDEAAAMLGAPGVVVLPAEAGISAGFERVDINHAAAGAMRVPGRLVERLSDLPPDCDVASSLLRIALQAGSPLRNLPAGLLESGRWSLVRTDPEAHAVEAGWIRLHTSSGDAVTAGTGAALLAVRSFGPSLLHAGSGGNHVAAGAFALAALAFIAAWLGSTALALVLAGLAWVARKAAELLLRVERDSRTMAPGRLPREAAFGWAFDAMLVVILGWGMAADRMWAASPGTLERFFPAFVLVALVRLVPRAFEGRWTDWLADRMLLCLILAVATIGGILEPAVLVLAAALALSGAAWPRRNPG